MQSTIKITSFKKQSFCSSSSSKSDHVDIPVETAPTAITYSWHQVNVFAKATKKGRKLKNNTTNEEKHILKNVTGICRPGELLAIMGASGAGKTTLLNVLNLKSSRKLRIEGDLYINGEPLERKKFTNQSAYVQQEDLFIGTCTVKEQLVFQALLRMDKEIPREKRMQKVNEVIKDLGLGKCRNTVIGIPGRLKGISGGETKRLAFACEILTDPLLMFCDEPTTGLDSFMAQNIVLSMKALAARGKNIISTIHQPSSEVFSLFDHILLMADGRVAYLGLTSETQQFFSTLDRHIPSMFNPADFFISSLAIIPGSEKECHQFIDNICDVFQDSNKGKNIDEDVKANMVSREENNKTSGSSRFKGKVEKESPYKNDSMVQFKALLVRSCKEIVREPAILRQRGIQVLILSMLLGLVYLDTDDFYDQDNVRNINGFLFFLVINTSYTYCFSTVRIFCEQRPVFFREHFSGMYRTDAYFIAKALAEVPQTLVFPVFFLLFTYFMVHIDASAASFFIMAANIILIANCGHSFGHFVSCMTNDVTTSVSIAAPLLIPLMLFGGYFLNSETVPAYFIWVKFISWFNYGYEIFIVTQWRYVDYIKHGNSSLDFKSGLEVINMMGYDEDALGFNFGMMIGLIVFYRIFGFLILLYKTYRHK